MKMILIGALAAVAVGAFAGGIAPTAAQAATIHPWCYDGTGNATGVPLCSYDSYEQCVKNAAGQCIRNPNMYWPGIDPPPWTARGRAMGYAH